MILTVVVQNLGMGGLTDSEGEPEPHRWLLLTERITAQQPDLLLLCETAGWTEYGRRQLSRAMQEWDLEAVPRPTSRSGNGVLLMYRPSVLGRWVRHNDDFSTEFLHGFAVTTFDVGLPVPIAVAPLHCSPCSAEQAMIEANWAASRGYRYGPYVVVGGDINFAPAEGPEPAYRQMRPYNVGSRCELPPAAEPDAPLRPDRRVARILAHNGLVDVAAHLYRSSGDTALLARTGTDDRIDQAWVSRPLAGAVRTYRLLNSPGGASDHHGLAFEIDTDAIDTSNPWTYQ